MNKILYQIRLLRDVSFLLGVVPSLALAATTVEALSFETIPLLAYLITFISATLGGLAGTLHRMAKHLGAGAESIAHPKVFVGANMLGGFAAGWFSFLVGTHTGTPIFLVQSLVLISSFGGAAVVERLVDKYFPKPKD